jgi:hypothetical protein
MKKLSTSEKLSLIRMHGKRLAKTGRGIGMPVRSDTLASAQRIIDLAKSIPKTEWAIEE